MAEHRQAEPDHTDQPTTHTDPVGLLSTSDVQALRGADAVSFHSSGDGVARIHACLSSAALRPAAYLHRQAATAVPGRGPPRPPPAHRGRRQHRRLRRAAPLARTPPARRHRAHHHRRRPAGRGVAVGRRVPAARRRDPAALAGRQPRRHAERPRSAPRRAAHRRGARYASVDVPPRRTGPTRPRPHDHPRITVTCGPIIPPIADLVRLRPEGGPSARTVAASRVRHAPHDMDTPRTSVRGGQTPDGARRRPGRRRPTRDSHRDCGCCVSASSAQANDSPGVIHGSGREMAPGNPRRPRRNAQRWRAPRRRLWLGHARTTTTALSAAWAGAWPVLVEGGMTA